MKLFNKKLINLDKAERILKRFLNKKLKFNCTFRREDNTLVVERKNLSLYGAKGTLPKNATLWFDYDEDGCISFRLYWENMSSNEKAFEQLNNFNKENIAFVTAYRTEMNKNATKYVLYISKVLHSVSTKHVKDATNRFLAIVCGSNEIHGLMPYIL